MDPISQLFAAYLEMVSSNIVASYEDAANTRLVSQRLVYEDTAIGFQHQLWRIRDQSVCADIKQDVTQYAYCTRKAKRMFTSLCQQLSRRDDLNPHGRRLSTMYCNASLSYKPMIAHIGEPSLRSEQQRAQKRCNELILKAMQDKSPEVQQQKAAACAKANG
ncbi:hypothetical protein [Shewanella halotolerans]|uniref:hypothetical protein n=1 Tax=Shewanella halotolerans TaxID=2864204 RepID=UPI001C655ED7|nr:hypothetical protein [Shewanella halotolerans]QYJ90850.1 hypothetical protein K0H81_04415 [Shewanella halotolerans]